MWHNNKGNVLMQKFTKLIKDKFKLVHILIIVFGIAFLMLSNFHRGLWFDESYSVAISAHSFGDIWSIGGHDVHPVLYYWLLHIVRYFFGNEVIAFRLFSVIVTSILGILGYTHIRKDFGEKVGVTFSFFTFFLPITLVYSGEIRMYSLAMLLTTLTAIYAYRIYKKSNEKNKKNWILFCIFSLSAAYTHYYSLAASTVINVFLFVFFVRKSVKQKKFAPNLRRFIISAIVQIALYVPWLIYLFLQMKQVSAGFWIQMTFPKTPIEMFLFQFTGNLNKMVYVPNLLGAVYGAIICIYLIYLYIRNSRKDKTGMRPFKYSLGVYVLVLFIIFCISIIVPILYARYMLCITGLFIFFVSFIMGKYGNKYINIIIMCITLVLSTYINVELININYDKSNSKPIEYLQENIQEGDIIIYGNEASGFVVSVNFPEVKQYFFDGAYWNVDEAYKAYGPNMTVVHNLDMLENYKGRMWVINSNTTTIANEIMEKYNNAQKLDEVYFYTEYKEKYEYTFCLLEMK